VKGSPKRSIFVLSNVGQFVKKYLLWSTIDDIFCFLINFRHHKKYYLLFLAKQFRLCPHFPCNPSSRNDVVTHWEELWAQLNGNFHNIIEICLDFFSSSFNPCLLDATLQYFWKSQVAASFLQSFCGTYSQIPSLRLSTKNNSKIIRREKIRVNVCTRRPCASASFAYPSRFRPPFFGERFVLWLQVEIKKRVKSYLSPMKEVN